MVQATSGGGDKSHSRSLRPLSEPYRLKALSQWGDELADAAMVGFRDGAIEATAGMAPRVTPISSVRGTRTPASFLKEVAIKAEGKVGGTGAVAGTDKHAYAARLIYRYQRRFGPGGQGLSTEQSYQAGQWLGRNINRKGSVGLDVVEGPDRHALCGSWSLHGVR